MTATLHTEEITMRTRFVQTVSELLDEEPTTALVLADISASLFAEQAERHPDRVLNVGIRESLMISVGGGLALTGLRPIIHTFASFLVERAFEQIKLDLTHQGVSAVLVSIGASYDRSVGGRTARFVTWLDRARAGSSRRGTAVAADCDAQRRLGLSTTVHPKQQRTPTGRPGRAAGCGAVRRASSGARGWADA
jgi:hypothetical protein